jgi:hypothetical protein
VALSNVERSPACDTLFGLAQAVLTAAPEAAPPPA